MLHRRDSIKTLELHFGPGTSVAFHADTALLCAQSAVYLFQKTAAGWVEQGKIFSGFTSTITMHNNQALGGRGCSSCPDAGLPASSFAPSGGTWAEVAQFLQPGSTAAFGISIALSDTEAFKGDGAGGVFSFPF